MLFPKLLIVKEVEETNNASLVSRRYDLMPGTVTRWVREVKGRKWIYLGYPVVSVLKIIDLNRSTYYYNIQKGGKADNTEEDTMANKGCIPIPGYSFDKDGNKGFDKHIKNIS